MKPTGPHGLPSNAIPTISSAATARGQPSAIPSAGNATFAETRKGRIMASELMRHIYSTSGAILFSAEAKNLRSLLGLAVLSGADLRGADLRGADLRDANLSGADLRGVDLSGANLRGATGFNPWRTNALL